MSKALGGRGEGTEGEFVGLRQVLGRRQAGKERVVVYSCWRRVRHGEEGVKGEKGNLYS